MQRNLSISSVEQLLHSNKRHNQNMDNGIILKLIHHFLKVHFLCLYLFLTCFFYLLLTCYFISGIVEENKLRRVRMAYAVSSFMEYHDILKMWRIKHNSLEDGCQ